MIFKILFLITFLSTSSRSFLKLTGIVSNSVIFNLFNSSIFNLSKPDFRLEKSSLSFAISYLSTTGAFSTSEFFVSFVSLDTFNSTFTIFKMDLAYTWRPANIPWRSPKSPNIRVLQETFKRVSRDHDLMKNCFLEAIILVLHIYFYFSQEE